MSRFGDADDGRSSKAAEQIYRLDTELKIAMNNHSELLKACTELGIRTDEIVRKAKLGRLRSRFDFKGALDIMIKKDMPQALEYVVKPFLGLNIHKTFDLVKVEDILSYRPYEAETPEQIEEETAAEIVFEDELDDERFRRNAGALMHVLLEMLTKNDEFTLGEYNDAVMNIFGSEVFKNGDYYAFLVHLCGKKDYFMQAGENTGETFLDEIIAGLMDREEFLKYSGMHFILELADGRQGNMENRNLEKALDIVTALFMGEDVKAGGANAMLYDEYSHNSEVYDCVVQILKRFDINLYEYNDSLFISAGADNRVFGYSNEELKKIMGLRLNKELFLVYFIIYTVIIRFYKDSMTGTFLEYIRQEDIVKAVSASLGGMIDHSFGIVMDEAEEKSFKAVALVWDELPDVSVEDKGGQRAAKNSRMGYVKLTFNFLITQNLFIESGELYYPTPRFKAIAEKYFEENRGRLHEILSSDKEEDTDAAD